MADNVEIQGLEFQVVGDTDKATEGVDKLTKSLGKLKKALSGLNATPIKEELKTTFSKSNPMSKVKTKTIQAQGQTGETISDLKAVTEKAKGYAQAAEQISATMRKAAPIGQKLHGVLSSVGAKLKEIPTNVLNRFKEGVVNLGKAVLSVPLGIFDSIKAKVKGLWATIKSIPSTIGNTYKKWLLSPFTSLKQGFQSAAKSAKHFLSSIGRVALYRIIRTLLSSITKVLKDGINNLNAYSKTMGTTFHQSLNTIATDALFLKNSLAAAVAPIINALAPAIDFLADKVAHLLNLLAQLFARLSGKSTYTKAVKAATEYGNAVGGAAEKAKSFTAGFDELNVFDPNSGGGGGGGLGDVSKMFEEATVDGEIASFADRLKELFKSGSWAELGTFIGEKFNEVVDSVSWDKLGTKIGKGVDAVVKTAYGFLKTADFRTLGSNIATAINKAVENIDFNTIGRTFTRFFASIIDFIASGLGSLDWKIIGNAIGGYFKGVFDETSEWLASVDWGKVGSTIWKSLKDVVTGIDFGGIAKSFFKMLGSAFGATVSLIATFFVDVWTDIKAYFSKNIEECGGDIPAGLWKGIKDGFKNVVSWIKENMVDPFVEGFKKCFGIHSPSTVMEELGGYVVQGFFKGIEKFSSFLYKVEEWANAVVEWFRKGEDGKGIVENFKELATNIVTGFKDKVGTTYHTVKTNVTTWASKVREWYTNSSFGGINRTNFANYANEVISGFREKIGTTYTTVKTNITTWASNVKTWFTSSSYGGVNSTNFSTYANNIITGFKDKIGSAYTTVKSSITTWASNVRDWFTSSSYGGVNYSNFSTYAGNVISGFKDKISNSYTNVKSSITTWASSVKDWFTSSSYGGVNSSTFSTFAANVISGFKTKIGNSYTDAKANMQTFASNVKSWFTGTVSYSSFYSVASDVISGFKNGIGNLYSTCKNTIKNWGSDIIEWFKGVLGINSPSKVFYQMADFSVQGFNRGFDTLGKSTKGVVGTWANSFTKITPTMGFAVDTSALKYYDSAAFAKNISTDVYSSNRYTMDNEFPKESLVDSIIQALTDSGLVADVRRQADKKEQTVVQIGNRTITDVVNRQQNANGYQFTMA